MRKVVLIAAAAFALTACGGNARKRAAAADTSGTTVVDMHTAETSLDYVGTYEGTLPAADCPGIRTTLTLNPDGTYTVHLKYLERDSEFDEKGSYTLAGNLLTLTPADGGQPSYYKVEENRLRMLDAEKQPVAGPLADNYILQKTTDTAAEPQPAYLGTYAGIDGPDYPRGGQVTLELLPDSTYRKTYSREQDEYVLEVEGRYRVEGDLLILYLSDSDREISWHRIETEGLRRLDADKQILEGTHGEKYILQKIN